MNTTVNRRTALLLGVAGFATAAGFGRALADDKQLRMMWWGSQLRADLTQKVTALYTSQHPGVTVQGETTDFGSYWPRLATEAVGRNLPDLIQMDFRYIRQYANNGALLALDQYQPNTLKIDDFGQAAINAGQVDGKIYGVSLGLSSTCTVYNKAALTKAGVQAPTDETSWTELKALALAITKWGNANGGNFWGVQDAGGLEPSLEVWLRERGKGLYTADGQLGYDADDIKEWFSFWDDMRTSGACVTPDVQALDKADIPTNMVSLGKAAISFANSNQYVGMQAVVKDPLGICLDPSGGPGAKPGPYLRPAQYLSVAASTKYPEDAVSILNFFVENVDAGKILGVERGVPPSAAVREAVAQGLDPLNRISLDFISNITSKVGPSAPPPPQGAGEVYATLPRYNQAVGFKQQSVADAAAAFVDEVKSILARSANS